MTQEQRNNISLGQGIIIGLLCVIIVAGLFYFLDHINSETSLNDENNQNININRNNNIQNEKSIFIPPPKEKTMFKITSPYTYTGGTISINANKITIKGEVTPNAELSLNGVNLPLNTSQGTFKLDLDLPKIGDNLFTFEAYSPDKDRVSQDVTIERTLSDVEITQQEQQNKLQEQQKAEEEKQQALQKETEYKAGAITLSYNKLVKNPDSYDGERVYYKGEIFQAGNEAGKDWFIISVTNLGYGLWSDNIFVEYDDTTDLAKGDVVRFWGDVQGAYTYLSMAGYEITIPRVHAAFIHK